MEKKLKVYVPILLSIALIIGFALGVGISPTGQNQQLIPIKRNNFNLLSEIVNYIDKEYVDTVQKQELIDKTVSYLLQELDPHSYYISAEEIASMNEPLEGNFEGIGIQFNIRKDTVVVVTPLSGGPSEKVGVKAGDRIIKVDSLNIAGIGIKNSDVLKKLKGRKGTKVNIEVQRKKQSDLLSFDIIRDKIPIHSVDVAYMVDSNIGYIKVSRFAKTTYEEFMEAGKELLQKGMNTLVIDLRGNGGGFLKAAVGIADEFLGDGKTIVFTEGRSRPKEVYYSSSNGLFQETNVVVLIDGSSASASEILAGAIQDNDRGTIIGRRSFGKGLVQEQASWPDGSATRLTTARYYTPTGRSIQKPYENGSKEYHSEYYSRFRSGELVSADSIDFPDSLIYHTESGKIVYGGGGIMPDYFIPIDTSSAHSFFNQLIYKGLIYEYAFEYSDSNRDKIKGKYPDHVSFSNSFHVNDKMLKEVVGLATKNGLKPSEKEIQDSRDKINRRIIAYIARNLWSNEGFYPIWNNGDHLFKKAIEITKKGKS